MGIGPKLAGRTAGDDLHGPEDFDIAARRGQFDDAGLIDRGHERRGAAVHDRRFRSVDLDHGVVHTHAAQRREHMFGG